MKFPYQKHIYKLNDINKKIKQLKKYITNYLFNKDETIELPHYLFRNKINLLNISSFYNEDIYIKYWENNKDIILKEYYKIYKKINLEYLNNFIYTQYNIHNNLYFEILILYIIDKYKCKNILDLYLTTSKRLITSIVKDINYTGIYRKKDIKKNNDFFIKTFGKKSKNKQNLIKNIKSLNKDIKYDCIFIDIENKTKNISNKNLDKYWNMLSKKGILVISFFNKSKYINNIVKHLKNIEYDILKFNKQRLYVFRKKKKKIIKEDNKKTYLILSTYYARQYFNIYFKKYKDWKEVDKYYNKIDLIIVDNLYKWTDYYYNLKSNIISIVDFKEPRIDRKNILHSFVKKNNPQIFKKYFLNQIDIDKNNLNKYKKYFKNNKKWFIKPIPGSSGKKIIMTKNFNDFENHIKKTEDTYTKWVIQENYENLLLFKEKKFHLRIYFCVFLINGIKYLFLFNKIENIFVYTAKSKFKDNSLNKDIVNSHGSATIKNDMIKFNILLNNNKNKNKINNQLIELFKYIKKIIKIKCFNTSKYCYNLYSCDILVNKNYNIKLIEINKNSPYFYRFLTKNKKYLYQYKYIINIIIKYIYKKDIKQEDYTVI